MDDKRILFKALMGSHLYGTAGPDSDRDYKAVYLPYLGDVLLGKRLRNYQWETNGVEQEFIPLQVYLDHFFAGQTYALEIAFVANHHAWVAQLVDQFLTRDVQKMMGYAISQAQVYGLKAERAEQVQRAYELVHSACAADPGILGARLNEKGPLADLQALPFVKQIEIIGGQSTKVPAIEINGKKFPYSATWMNVWHSLERSVKVYGSRTKSYSEAKADLKAMSHAIRVIGQIKELCATGRLTFPRPDAEYLRDVKYGRVPVNEAKQYLQEEFEAAEIAIVTSMLPERTPTLEADFEKFKLKILQGHYGL